MGQGPTLVAATFRREKDSADFDLNLQIKTTPPATQMNDLLRAHGGFDVVAGSFSLFSEISVRGRYIDGYVKPFFKDLDVYDPRQEKKREWLSNCRKG